MKPPPRLPVPWDASGYHTVSAIQERWGVEVLRSLPAGAYGRILDAGCGSGRLTLQLLRMHPGSRVTALDRSGDMLRHARRVLHRFARRVEFVQGDLQEVVFPGAFSLIFSNATFHWILDHRRLYGNLIQSLAPQGVLLAQCGGTGNLNRVARLARILARRSRFRPFVAGYEKPVRYASVQETREAMKKAGFVDIEVSLDPKPAVFRSAREFREFVRQVVCMPVLSVLPPELRSAYLDVFTAAYADRFGRPYQLDYVRLNLRARKRS